MAQGDYELIREHRIRGLLKVLVPFDHSKPVALGKNNNILKK